MRQRYTGQYMRSKRRASVLISLIALLWCLSGIVSFATSVTTDGATTTKEYTTGEKDSTTVKEPPGSAESADELAELNVANNLTVTYNDGNGTLAGSLRILLVLTGIALAPSLIIMLTSFTRIIIVLHFTRSALNTQTAPPNQTGEILYRFIAQ